MELQPAQAVGHSTAVRVGCSRLGHARLPKLLTGAPFGKPACKTGQLRRCAWENFRRPCLQASPAPASPRPSPTAEFQKLTPGTPTMGSPFLPPFSYFTLSLFPPRWPYARRATRFWRCGRAGRGRARFPSSSTRGGRALVRALARAVPSEREFAVQHARRGARGAAAGNPGVRSIAELTKRGRSSWAALFGSAIKLHENKGHWPQAPRYRPAMITRARAELTKHEPSSWTPISREFANKVKTKGPGTRPRDIDVRTALMLRFGPEHHVNFRGCAH